MLEKIPHWLGSALTNVRAGHDKLTLARLDLEGAAMIRLSSPAFAAGDRLPPRFTADGDGVSPPLVWSDVPDGTTSLALIVEDPDAPAPRPLVHAIVVDIDPTLNSLSEGSIVADGAGDGEPDGDTGRNSYLREGWLPPDPPTGHGPHDYVFQLLALGAGADEAEETSPGRSDFIDLVRDRVIGAGVLVGTYSRGESAAIGGIAGAAAPA